MARIRSMKPEYPKDELLGTVSRDARLLYPLLWLIADDDGRFRCSVPIIKAECFPYDDDLKSKDVRRILDELVKIKRVVEYEADGQKYGWMPNFHRHQKIDHPTKSRLPPPPEKLIRESLGNFREDSRDFRGGLDGMGLEGKGSGLDQDGKGTGEGEPDAAARLGGLVPPSPPREAEESPSVRLLRARSRAANG